MKTKYYKSKNKKVNKKAISRVSENTLARLKLIIFIAISIVMFYPPFVRGLYFELEQLPAIIFTLVTFIVFWVYKYLKRDDKFLETPLEYAAFAFTIVYLLSIFVAVGLHQAIFEWLKYCMYFAVFYMLSQLADSIKWRLATLWVIVASATGVAILGIDGAAGGGIAKALNTVFRGLGAQRDIFFDTFVGGRVNSTLQYPNALASYLMAAYFVCLGLIIASDKLRIRVIGSVLSSLLFLTFLLTTSRGAYILFPIIAIVFLIISPKESRVRGAASGFATIVPALLIFIRVTSYISPTAGNATKIWISVIAGAAASALIISFMNYAVKWLEKISWKVYATIAGIIVIAGISCAIYVLNASVPLVLDNSTSEKDTWVTCTQREILKPGREYKLSLDVEAINEGDKPFVYQVTIYSRSINDILFDGNTRLETYMEKETKGASKNEITFKVPEDSRIIDFNFINYYAGTKAAFNNAKIIDVSTGKVYKELMLSNKYLPIATIIKFKNLSLDKSSLQRAVYYKDGLKMFRDRWFLGAGGGAWGMLYFSYQSYLYWSTQAHNYPLQTILECGVFGLIALLLLIASIIYMVIKSFSNKGEERSRWNILQAALVSAIAPLIVHSAMDFDFSLSAVFLLFWELAAVFNSMCIEQGLMNMSFKKTEKDTSNKKRPKLFMRKLNVNPLAIATVSFLVLLIPMSMLLAGGYRDRAVKALDKKDFESALNNMKAASSLDPFKPEYKIDFANLLIQKPDKAREDINEANRYISKAESLAYRNPQLLPKVGAYYLSTGELEKGLGLFERSTELRPFRPEEWEQKINAYMQVALYYFNNNDMENGMDYLDKTLAIIHEAKEINKKNMNPFIFNASTMDMLEKLKYVKDNYNKQETINIAKTAFYSINDLDINFDSIPDQWTIHGQEHMNLSYNGGIINIDNNSDDKWGYFQSRELRLFPDKEYIIEIEAASHDIMGKPISFNVSGVSKETKGLIQEKNIYTGEFSTPADFESGKNHLTLYIKESLQIKSIKIAEK